MNLKRVLPALILSVVLIASMACLFGCGGAGSADVAVDLGSSDIYDEATRQDAADMIQKEVAGWDGCELHKVTYMGDEQVTDENLTWMNEIAAASGGPEYAEVIAFKADYHTPKDAEEAGAWEPDTEMTDWEFWMARPEGGDWVIVTNGY